MRILHLNDDVASFGGSTQVMMSLCKALAEHGHDIHIVGSAAQSHSIHVPNDVTMQTLIPRHKRWAHFRSVFSRKRSQEVMACIDAFQPDIIHAHLLAWQLGYRWIHSAMKKGIPCVYTFHTVMPIAYGKITTTEGWLPWHDCIRARWTYNPLRNMLIRRALQRTHLIAVSDALNSLLRQHGYRNIHTLHNGIDTAFWKKKEDKNLLRQKMHLPANAPIFMLAGRLSYGKGVSQLMSIWQHLRNDALLLLVGTPHIDVPENMRERILYMGEKNPEEMRSLYTVCDAVLIPSLCFDSFPTIALEAMSCGIPVLAADRGGAKEAILHEKTGWILPAEDQASWKMQITWCIEHQKDMNLMGHCAREHIEKHFSHSIFVQEMEKIYEACV